MNLRIIEPVPLTAGVRYQSLEIARHVWHGPGRAAFRRSLDRLPPVARGQDPRPCFGWLQDPRRAAETAIGGGVKLGHLRAEFGEHRENFNLLVLVSSILHLVPHVEELVAFAKARRIPIVWNQNGVAYPSWCGDAYPWFNRPMRNLIHQADHVIYQSAFCRASADRYLGPVSSPNEILWNPVDLDHFSPITEKSVDGDELRLLAMGTNHSFYRVRSSLDAFSELRRRGSRARLTIAGELRWHRAEAETAAYVSRLGLDSSVIFLPRFQQSEAPAIYRSADILLHPKYKDPCPTVPIEAMACGVPVVGSASGGMPELVPGTAGRLVAVPDDWSHDHAPDPRGVADAVESILGDLDAKRRGARLHACASFDRRQWVARHAEIFSALLESSGRSGKS